MQKKEIVLTLGLLAKKGACKLGIEEFKKWYPSGSAPLSEVFRKLQELANTTTDYVKYVDYAKWLICRYPPTQEPLVLDELTEKVIIHNGDINIKSGIDGERFIIGNGDLNIKDGVNVTGQGDIWAEKTIKAINIVAYDRAGILAGTIDAQNITAYGNAGIDAKTIDAINIEAKDFAGILAGTIDAEKIAAKDFAVIRAWETIDTINIAAKGLAGIWAEKINTQNIMDGDRTRIHGDINLIQPSSNPQNVTQPAY